MGSPRPLPSISSVSSSVSPVGPIAATPAGADSTSPGLRVAVVTESFLPAVNATTTTVKAVADRLVDRGHTVRILAPAPGLSTYRSSHVARIRPLEPVGAQVRSALEAFAPDVVYVCSPGAVGRKALKHCRAVGVGTVLVEQSPVLELAADYWRTRMAARADRVLVTSAWMVDRLAEFDVESRLWAPGVDTRAFTPALRDQWLHDSWSRARSARGPRVVVGYVGGLHKRHGVRDLAALARLDGVRPVVVGEGTQRAWLEARLPGAKFTGPLTGSDLAVALPTLDLLVHPGRHETCCHALREAAASGVPVVAPRSGGAPDVVRHQETGLLYDPADPHALLRAVASVAADPQRGLLGRHGRELALQRTWDVAVDELETVLRELAPTRSTPRSPLR